MPPVIGISTRPRVVPTSGGELGVDSVQHTYRDAVQRAGGIPLLLAPVPDAHIEVLLDRLHGLVLTGGGDVDPATYGSDERDRVYAVDGRRDAFEFALTRGAQARKMPVLAICRGLQVVNVALGGTLIEDIPTALSGPAASDGGHAQRGDAAFRAHQAVNLEPGCLLARTLGTTDLMVNSIHHQAVRRIAPGLRTVGAAADGVIEAIEADDESWPLLAVQWHPEYLSDAGDAASHRLFAALVAAADVEAAGRR
ncbi:MAG: gamma-glutamyl-gamma-aminobutyrate hydrolase family protein [Acidimicrobiia bacterium]